MVVRRFPVSVTVGKKNKNKHYKKQKTREQITKLNSKSSGAPAHKYFNHTNPLVDTEKNTLQLVNQSTNQ